MEHLRKNLMYHIVFLAVALAALPIVKIRGAGLDALNLYGVVAIGAMIAIRVIAVLMEMAEDFAIVSFYPTTHPDEGESVELPSRKGASGDIVSPMLGSAIAIAFVLVVRILRIAPVFSGPFPQSGAISGLAWSLVGLGFMLEVRNRTFHSTEMKASFLAQWFVTVCVIGTLIHYGGP